MNDLAAAIAISLDALHARFGSLPLVNDASLSGSRWKCLLSRRDYCDTKYEL